MNSVCYCRPLPLIAGDTHGKPKWKPVCKKPVDKVHSGQRPETHSKVERGERECGGAEGIFQQRGVSVSTVLGALLWKQSLRWAFYANDSWRESWENCVGRREGGRVGQGKEVGKDVVSELVQAQPDLMGCFGVEGQKSCCLEARGLGCCAHIPPPITQVLLVSHWPWAAPRRLGDGSGKWTVAGSGSICWKDRTYTFWLIGYLSG